MRIEPALFRPFFTLGILLVGCSGTRPRSTAAPVEEPVRTERVEAKPEPAGPDCSDGGCIRCGDAECPQGFFCDESNRMPSCQWVPACKQTVTCDCVKEALTSTCRCSERDGGVYVKCTN